MRILYPNSGSRPRYCSQQHGTEVWAQRKGKTHAQALVQNSPSPRCVQGLPGPRMRPPPPSPWPPPLEPWRLGLSPSDPTEPQLQSPQPRLGGSVSASQVSRCHFWLARVSGMDGSGSLWIKVGRLPPPGPPPTPHLMLPLPRSPSTSKGEQDGNPKGRKERRERGGQAVHANQASRTVV
ncbi:hypothetical protein CCUS01_09648 [Colletotrichum cuscutae]|uniref:Uncharacterized protein n=1 Tax=Colletotrichum cuscutae TaxID=1209917 RepID=A0AAI9XRG4_9PEZI|nr:hypothetical protein CCUS01_09648 [Colletotrichum cuscutae]